MGKTQGICIARTGTAHRVLRERRTRLGTVTAVACPLSRPRPALARPRPEEGKVRYGNELFLGFLPR